MALSCIIALWLTDIIEGQYISRRLLWAISTLIFGQMDPTGSFGVIWNGNSDLVPWMLKFHVECTCTE